MKLHNRVAIVTGGGSGIGRAICQLFASEGARVAIVDRDAATAEETLQQLGTADTATFVVDVANPAAMEALMAEVHARWGRLDILCNNAAIISTTDVVTCEPAEWDQVMAVNARGVFLGCKYALPYMLRQGHGCIINTASTAAHIGLPQRAAYSASKGAVLALTRQIAIEYSDRGIRANSISPGTVDTPLVAAALAGVPAPAGRSDPTAARATLLARQPLGRIASPAEIAAAALYLASDDAAFVTGTDLVIDGGLTAR